VIFQVLTVTGAKMAVTDVSDDLTVSIIRAMSKQLAVPRIGCTKLYFMY
jgi:hypothetical protein